MLEVGNYANEGFPQEPKVIMSQHLMKIFAAG
jgi:hypothetical protein